MKNLGHRTAWAFAQRLWVAIALTVAAGCSADAVDDLTGPAGDGANGAVSERPNTEEAVSADDVNGERTPGGESLVAPPSNATTCTADNQCASGFCTDGFCCDTRCNNLCTACSAAKKGSGVDGVCGNIAYDTDPDKECSQGKCSGAGSCQSYNGYSCTAGSQCLSSYCVDGVCCGSSCGQFCYACSTARKGYGANGACEPIASGSDPQSECNPGECNGAGACNQPQALLANGTACVMGSQCTSGNCADGVCCDTACTGTCQACTYAKKGTGATGTCGNIVNDYDPDNECANGACSGSGTCQLYNGLACTATSQCLSNYCVDGFCCGASCTGSCKACSTAKKGYGSNGVCEFIAGGQDPDSECNPGECSGSGGCNQPQTLLGNGASCVEPTQCASGFCADGVCCDTACNGLCKACTAAKKGSGTNGTCGNIKYDFDPDNECSTGSCSGSGTCQSYNGYACTASSECLSSYCVDGFCCGNSCTGSCKACSAAKKGAGSNGICENIVNGQDPDSECNPGECNGAGTCNQSQTLLANGSSCVDGTQCASGHCVDSVCCDTACTGGCQACTATKKGSGANGTCGNIKNDTDPDNECATGSCSGTGTCQSYNGYACAGASECLSSYCVDGVCCGGSCTGTCMACSATKKGSGSDGVCAAIANTTDPDNECNPGECNGSGACNQSQMPQPNGTTCSLGSQCTSGNCVDSVCCDTACTGTCVACTAAKKGQGTNGTCGNIITNTDPDNECTNSDCNGSGACTSGGNLANGSACTAGGQCMSSQCVDGVCCDTACTETCKACTAAKKGSGTDGTCGNIKNDSDPDNECSTGSCSGTGTCQSYNGYACAAGNECLSTYCVDGFCCGADCTGTCMACSAAKKGSGTNGVCGTIANTTDPDNECNPGECNGSGACNQSQMPQPNGSACSLGSQCTSGNCVDGVCCDTACTGTCVACSATKKGQGSNGTCGNIITNTDPDNECTNSDCNGSGACTTAGNLPNGSACTTGGQCMSSQCVDGVCCDTACTATCKACTAAKKGSGTDGTCGDIKYDADPDNECPTGSCSGSGTCQSYNGYACAGASECLSTNCIDGFCCNNACESTCYACSATKKGAGTDGVCGTVKSNTDPDNDCSGSGVCNGSGVCTTPTCSSNADCGANATCTNSACACNSGYSGDGYTCTDIDECTFSNGGCDANATCTNTPGSRTCACNSGYSGDGLTCVVPPPVQHIASNGNTTCIITDNGRMKCWGGNSHGQLGLGDTNDRGDAMAELYANLPDVLLGTGLTPTNVAVGATHTCAILTGGVVKCWGRNANGQLGVGDTNDRGDGVDEMGDNLPAVDLGTGKTATQITVGESHTCALLNDNTVKCWGNPANGRLGQGHIMQHGDGVGPMGDGLPIVELGTGKTAISISTFYDATCALLNDATIKCWGANASGQLGQGDVVDRGGNSTDMGDNLLPIDLGTGKTALSVSAGKSFACALLNDSTVKCWGANDMGQLGQGDTSARGDDANEMGDNLLAIDLGAGKLAATLFGGMEHACVVLTDASIKCWGGNTNGQLGLEDTNARGDAAGEMGDNLSAINVGTGKTATIVAPGNQHTCARLNDGFVKCWGQNANGQLGLGDATSRGSMTGEMGDNLPAARLF